MNLSTSLGGFSQTADPMSSVINLGDHRSYFLYRKETEMRKGFDSLCGVVLNELGRQVTKGDGLSSSINRVPI